MAEYTIDLCTDGSSFSDGDYADHGHALAFDDDTGTEWWSDTSAVPMYIGYQCSSAHAFVKLRIKAAANRVPNAFKVQGSNNGSDYDDLKSDNMADNADWQEFTWTNTTKYSYVRIYITSLHAPTYVGRVAEIEVMAWEKPVGGGFSGISPWIF